MPAIGKLNSYATVQPNNQNYVGDAMQYTEQQARLYRAEDEAKKEKAKLEKAQEQEKFVNDLGKIKADTTKFSTHNAVVIDAMDKLRNGVGEKWREMKDGKISQVDYQIYKNNALSQIGLIDQTSKRINAQAEDYAKQVAEGKIASQFVPNALNFGGAYDKANISLELNPDGTMTSLVYDDEGNVIDKGGLATIGQNAFTPVYNYDLDKDKTEFIKAYPKVLNERFVGNTKEGIKGIDPKIEEAIDLKVEAIVKNPNALAIQAQALTGVPKAVVTDENVIKKVRENLKTEFLGLYAPEKNVDEATQRANLAFEKKKEARKIKKEEEEKPIISQVETPPVYTEAGIRPSKGYTTVSTTKTKPIDILEAVDNKTNKREKFNNAKISSYTVRKKKDGQRVVVAEINYEVQKAKRANIINEYGETVEVITEPAVYKTRMVNITEKDGYKFAKSMGLDSFSEMKDRAKVQGVKEEEVDEYGVPIK